MGKKIFFYMSSSFHNAYRHMVANAPDGFSIMPSENLAQPFIAKNSKPSAFSSVISSLASPFYNKMCVLLNRPKERKFHIDGYDLIHSGQSILDTELPYVMDFEHAAVFSGYNQFAFSRPGFLNALKKKLLNPRLKKLTPWSNAARMSLLNFIKDKELEEKTETVYPVVTPPPEVRKEKHDGINLLFVGGVFYEKGAYDVLLAFDRISKKYDATLTIVSNVPTDVAARFSKNPKISLPGPQPYDKVKSLYLKSDIFTFPTHYDTFGYVIPEAFSYGLPVICDNSFSRPELVEDGKTGIIVNNPYSSYNPDFSYKYPTYESLSRRKADCMNPDPAYISSLSEAMARLIEDSSLLKRLSSNARKEATEGKFSPKIWKERMGRIYEEALRN